MYCDSDYEPEENLLETLKAIEYKRKTAFEAFIRINSNNEVPWDIIHLCFLFYQIELQFLAKWAVYVANDGEWTEDLYKIAQFAQECYNNGDMYLSFQLFNLEVLKRNLDDRYYAHLMLADIHTFWQEYYESVPLYYSALKDAPDYERFDDWAADLDEYGEYHATLKELKTAFSLSGSARHANLITFLNLDRTTCIQFHGIG